MMSAEFISGQTGLRNIAANLEFDSPVLLLLFCQDLAGGEEPIKFLSVNRTRHQTTKKLNRN